MAFGYAVTLALLVFIILRTMDMFNRAKIQEYYKKKGKTWIKGMWRTYNLDTDKIKDTKLKAMMIRQRRIVGYTIILPLAIIVIGIIVETIMKYIK